MRRAYSLLCLVLFLLIASIPIQGQRVRIPKSPNDWDIELLDGRKVKWGVPEIPQLTYSAERLWEEFDRPIYLTTWLVPSLLIHKQAGWEEYKEFIDTLVEGDYGNSLRAFSAGVWERHTVDKVRFPFVKVNGKFDLEKINPEWLDETLRRIEYFVERGGTLVYTLIDKCSMYPNRDGHWKYHWWNGDNNINGTNNESKSIRYMYNWADRGILGASETKHYVLKFMRDIVGILEERFPGSIVYDFNEFGGDPEWFFNVDRDVFQHFKIPIHRKMFSKIGLDYKKYADIAEIITKYIWQPHGIGSLDDFYNFYRVHGLIQPSADGTVGASEIKLIVFNALSDGMVGFENNRGPWTDNFWDQINWDLAKGIKEGLLMFLEAHGKTFQRLTTRRIHHVYTN